MTVSSCLTEPFYPFLQVLLYTFALYVAKGKIVLCIGMILISGFVPQSHGFFLGKKTPTN